MDNINQEGDTPTPEHIAKTIERLRTEFGRKPPRVYSQGYSLGYIDEDGAHIISSGVSES